MPLDHDTVWKALADETRRTLLDQLRDGPKTTSQLVEVFPHLSRFAVMKHLGVLCDAGLVNTRREGRQRYSSLNAAPLRAVVERWIGKYDGFWANTLLRVKDDAELESSDNPRSRKKQA